MLWMRITSLSVLNLQSSRYTRSVYTITTTTTLPYQTTSSTKVCPGLRLNHGAESQRYSSQSNQSMDGTIVHQRLFGLGTVQTCLLQATKCVQTLFYLFICLMGYTVWPRAVLRLQLRLVIQGPIRTSSVGRAVLYHLKRVDILLLSRRHHSLIPDHRRRRNALRLYISPTSLAILKQLRAVIGDRGLRLVHLHAHLILAPCSLCVHRVRIDAWGA